MSTNLAIKSTLLTAAALLCTGLQFTGIDSLAAPRSAAAAEMQAVQLPLVLVTAQREPATLAIQQLPQVVVTSQRESTLLAVQQLPQVVVVGRRADRATATAQARDGASGAAI